MVEGHQVHRVAAALCKLLLGKAFEASSPNGRFADGAQLIHNKKLHRIEAHGKNLFYFFGSEKTPTVVHIHFGMSGQFSTFKLPGPEPTPTTRLRLVHQKTGTLAHLSAMTCEHGPFSLYEEKCKQLGPDPLREDADKERLWAKIQKGKNKPVGLFLMDQSAVAGIGNIYRAEILFKSGVHPEQPAATITRDQFETLWRHSVLLLQRGFTTGSILTVDSEENIGAQWSRRYIYNQDKCGRCFTQVQTWDMAGRTVYACVTCQPLRTGGEGVLTEARGKALSAAKPAKVFVSHCAPDVPGMGQSVPPAKMKIAQLKEALAGRGLDVKGTKAVLVKRLVLSLSSVETEKGVVEESKVEVEVVPGTAQLGGMASAAEAALEKVLAGENRAVEHVALVDEVVADEVRARKGKGKKDSVGVKDAGLKNDTRVEKVRTVEHVALVDEVVADEVKARKGKGKKCSVGVKDAGLKKDTRIEEVKGEVWIADLGSPLKRAPVVEETEGPRRKSLKRAAKQK